ncbi:hypothetical protein GCM10020331_021590 [Ectobacillus funiculus]
MDKKRYLYRRKKYGEGSHHSLKITNDTPKKPSNTPTTFKTVALSFKKTTLQGWPSRAAPFPKIKPVFVADVFVKPTDKKIMMSYNIK